MERLVKISLYFSQNYIQLQSVVSSITSWKHTVQAVPSKKKSSREKEERKTRWEKEKKRKEVEKRRRRKKGWKEFVRKKRKKGE